MTDFTYELIDPTSSEEHAIATLLQKGLRAFNKQYLGERGSVVPPICQAIIKGDLSC
jgi:hypothetical protein